MTTDVELAAAYSHCEAVTRAQAANFYYGIRLLPGERRRAMCAVYAFARRVDDIGDGALAAEEKLRLLDAQARALSAIGLAGSSAVPAEQAVGVPDAPQREPDAPASDPVMVALTDTQRRFPLPAGVLGELIEGVRMDVAGTSYEDFDELVVYCRRVAGAIGRVCLAIFGVHAGDAADSAEAERLADELGVALQLTNILRDVREDAENGRVYLPGAELRRFSVLGGNEGQSQGEAAAQLLAVLASAAAADAGAGPQAVERRERLEALVRFECERAREWFDRGITLTGMLDRRSAACVLAMAGIYRRLLERIEASPDEVARRRVSLPAHEKAWVAARGHAGGGGMRRPAPQGRRVLVIGGGLAGIAAALDCAAAGASVTLVEVRRRLGGAAYSFERDGLQLDNGQHVFLRCCSAYRALLARLGSEQLTFVQPRLEIPVLSPGSAPALLRRGSLPAPATPCARARALPAPDARRTRRCRSRGARVDAPGPKRRGARYARRSATGSRATARASARSRRCGT